MARQDHRSEIAEKWRAWYGTARWRATRQRQLATEPLCAFCKKDGQIAVATVCDHVERHNGDPVKFWSGPFQSLCKPHHDASKQREETAGYSTAVGLDGWPLDPRHPANAGTAARRDRPAVHRRGVGGKEVREGTLATRCSENDSKMSSKKVADSKKLPRQESKK
jgi:5-methylcytosine-specific restriction enzyme A